MCLIVRTEACQVRQASCLNPFPGSKYSAAPHTHAGSKRAHTKSSSLTHPHHHSHTPQPPHSGQGTDEDIVVSSARAYTAALNKLLAWKVRMEQHDHTHHHLEQIVGSAHQLDDAAGAGDDGSSNGSSSAQGGKKKLGDKKGSKKLVAA